MKYGLFIYEDETIYGRDKAGPKMQEIVSKHVAFSQWLGAKRIGGAGLAATATATTVRTAGGKKTFHDGPFAEAPTSPCLKFSVSFLQSLQPFFPIMPCEPICCGGRDASTRPALPMRRRSALDPPSAERRFLERKAAEVDMNNSS
jgi:hypothetical protein